jgi:hypothetical protein
MAFEFIDFIDASSTGCLAGGLRTHRIRSGNGITAALEVTGSLFLVQPRRQNPHMGTANTWR